MDSIIVGSRLSTDPNSVRYEYWLRVPVPESLRSKHANPTAVSIIPGATVEELAALRAGAVIEIASEQTVPAPLGEVDEQRRLIAAWREAKRTLEDQVVDEFPLAGKRWDGDRWRVEQPAGSQLDEPVIVQR